MNVARLAGVRLAIGGRVVLDNIDLAIEAGEFVGLLGANGAGKTTLMRALLGLLPPAAGHIEVLGQAARRGNPAIGYMPQSRSVAAFARLSGRDYVAAMVRGHRWGLPLTSTADRRAVDRALDLTGSLALAERPLGALSGGERQRLLLAQALLGEPRLLLLDEPLISLDPRRQNEVVTLVRQLQQELGIAVLFSAHELNPLLGALDRVLYLGGGGAAIGPVDEVITGPSLSRLYGSAIEVIRLNGRIFVMSDQYELERGEHVHDHSHDHGHGHA